MSHDPQEVVTIFSGPLVVVEAYREVLADAGIESKVTGESLLASFGSAIPGSIELYVHQGDAEKALEAIAGAKHTPASLRIGSFAIDRGDAESTKGKTPQSAGVFVTASRTGSVQR